MLSKDEERSIYREQAEEEILRLRGNEARAEAAAKEDETRACCCCQFETKELHTFMAGPCPAQEVEHRHCKICWSTLAGNRCVYGTQSYSDVGTVRLMAHLANLVIEAIKHEKP